MLHRSTLFCLAFVLATLAVSARADVIDPGEIVLVSHDAAGQEANDEAYTPAISGNGRFVAFASMASNLVAGDVNNYADVFLKDLKTGTIELVSRGLGGSGVSGGNGGSSSAAVSKSGRYVAFRSSASDLIAGDSNNASDIFVYDRKLESLERVSVATSGVQANGASYWLAIGNNKNRSVAFASEATNLVDSDTNGKRDVFVRDLKSGVTSRVSIGQDGEEANGACGPPSLSANGRYVAFWSAATNLDSLLFVGAAPAIFVHDRKTGENVRASVTPSGGSMLNVYSDSCAISGNGRFVTFAAFDNFGFTPADDNLEYDIFVRDLEAGTTTRVSIASDGTAGNGETLTSQISANGRFVYFDSPSTNLVEGDTNGERDIFVRDRKKGLTRRVSVGAGGIQSNGLSEVGTIADDGRTFVFDSSATNLVATPTSDFQVFARRW